MRAASSPGTHSGERETLVTHWLTALPQHLLVLPGDSWWPFFAALGTAGFFLLLTVAQLVLAFACGVVAIIAIMVWLWQTDQVAHAKTAEVADGVFLPVGASGPRSHTWWAMMILLCVDATVFGALVFAHVHVAMAAEVCPPPGASLPGGWWPALPAALLLAGSAAIAGAQAALSRSAQNKSIKKTLVWLLVLVATLCVLASAGFDLQAHQLARLQPTASAWSATVAALLAWQGFHVAVLLLMGGYVCVRCWSGKLRPEARSTIDNTAIFWHYVTAQGIAAMAVILLMPLL